MSEHFHAIVWIDHHEARVVHFNADAAEQLVVHPQRPTSAKHELVKHIERHTPKLLERVAGVETLDHPTDGALLGYARKYFQAAARMAPQRSSLPPTKG